MFNSAGFQQRQEGTCLSIIHKVRGYLAVLVALIFAPYVQSNEIVNCSVLDSGPGVTLTSTCTPGVVIFSKTFGQVPSFVDIRIDLGITPNGQSTTAQVIDSVTNMSDRDWTDFHISSPDASSLTPIPNLFFGFDSCINVTSTEIFCDGGVGIPTGGNFLIFFDLVTPADQTKEFFSLRQEPTFAVPEPATLAIAGCGLMLLGFKMNRQKRVPDLTEFSAHANGGV